MKYPIFLSTDSHRGCREGTGRIPGESTVRTRVQMLGLLGGKREAKRRIHKLKTDLMTLRSLGTYAVSLHGQQDYHTFVSQQRKRRPQRGVT